MWVLFRSWQVELIPRREISYKSEQLVVRLHLIKINNHIRVRRDTTRVCSKATSTPKMLLFQA